MSLKHNVQLIQEILNKLPKDGRDTPKQTIYELGYLIGMLARLANEDHFVFGSLKREHEKLEEKNKKDGAP